MPKSELRAVSRVRAHRRGSIVARPRGAVVFGRPLRAQPSRSRTLERLSARLARFMARFAAFLLSFCAAAASLGGVRAASAAAQGGDEVGSRLSRLRDARITIDERERLCGELLGLGESGALALSRLAVEQVERAVKRAEGLEAKYLKGFEKASLKLVAGRSTKAELAKVEEARKAVRGLRAKEELSKSDIHEIGDPAVDLLRGLFVVDAYQVLDDAKSLAKERDELSFAWFEAVDWRGIWERSSRLLGDAKRVEAPPEVKQRWDAVLAEEEWLCTLALPMTAQDRKVLVANRALTGQLDAEEALGVLDLNCLRLLLGLNALSIDVKLCDAARDHSNDMRTLGFFAHESPVPGKKTPYDRAARFGTSASSENIAAGHATGSGANRGWWYSPGHHKNMLGSHSRIGLGRSEAFWTQLFG